MDNSQIKDFYYGSRAMQQPTVENNRLKCRMQCFEWSDGRLGCQCNPISVVQQSPADGRFIWYTDFLNEASADKSAARHYTFRELQEAHTQLQERGGFDKDKEITLLMDIIRTYNDEHQRGINDADEISLPDFMFFVECILRVVEIGKGTLPPSLIAELYREACYFEKCLEFNTDAGRSKDEQEIIAEVQFRASHGDRKPFIIEQCECYRNSIRMDKRYPCPYKNC